MINDENDITVEFLPSNENGEILLLLNDNIKELCFITKLIHSMQLFGIDDIVGAFLIQLYENIKYAVLKYGQNCNLYKSYQFYWIRYSPELYDELII